MKDLLNQYDVTFFDDRLSDLGFDLTDHQINQFLNYYELLREWNKKMNLTAITEYDDVILKHFVDSVTFELVETPKAGASLIDVGSGAGFPGIPLKIVYPGLSVTLMDSLNKRITFLNEVIRELGLEDVRTVHSRAEDLGHDPEYRERYDYSVSRAVANISTLSEYCLPFVKVGGSMIAYKGGEVQDEMRKGIFGIRKLNGTLEKQLEFNIPAKTGESISRTLVVIRKKKATPKRYPRKAGTPAKMPL